MTGSLKVIIYRKYTYFVKVKADIIMRKWYIQNLTLENKSNLVVASDNLA